MELSSDFQLVVQLKHKKNALHFIVRSWNKSMKNISKIIQQKIRSYKTSQELIHSAEFFLSICKINHNTTKEHNEHVALISEAVAKKLKMDVKAAFFGGLFHDIGKITLPHTLFDGREINQEEYNKVKTHVWNGYKVLKKFHLFTAFCAGLHHNLYEAGYGLTVKDFPSNLSPTTVKKILEISTIISIADFIDAFTNRKTKIKNEITSKPTLQDKLYFKYPNDKLIVDTALNWYKDKDDLKR